MRSGDGDHTQLTTIMMGWWTTLRDAAGTGQVTIDDVLAVVDQLGQMPQAVTGTAEAMFEAVDENADGRISPAEYRQLIEAWNGRETDTSEAFTLLDLNHHGYGPASSPRGPRTAHTMTAWTGRSAFPPS